MSTSGSIRVGIGGWVFAPWKETFFPPRLPAARALEYASRQVTAIEINGTFYRTQTAASFKRWHDETPDDFVFSIKGLQYITVRKELGETGPSLQRFLDSGLTELRGKLGPVLWQFRPTYAFDPAAFEAFLELLPRQIDGLALRHAVEVRHSSFADPAFVALLRRHNAALVFADSDKHPMLFDATADFVYARLQRARAEEPTGYPADELDLWAARAKTWAAGGEPEGLPRSGPPAAAGGPRDCFVYMINGAKERAPAAARALLERLS